MMVVIEFTQLTNPYSPNPHRSSSNPNSNLSSRSPSPCPQRPRKSQNKRRSARATKFRRLEEEVKRCDEKFENLDSLSHSQVFGGP